MKKLYAAAVVLIISAFLFCGCSASGKVSASKGGKITENKDYGYTTEHTEDDRSDYDRSDNNDSTANDFSKNGIDNPLTDRDNDTGTAENSTHNEKRNLLDRMTGTR